MSNYTDQLKSLIGINYSFNLDYFSIDDCKIVERLLPKSGLKSTFVYECLKEYRKLSMSKPGFKSKVVTLRTDLHRYIDERVYLLSNFIEVRPERSFLFEAEEAPKIENDPWLSHIEQQKSDKESLIQASLHVRDILFAAHEVASVIPEEIENFLKELSSFQEKLHFYLQMPSELDSERIQKIEKSFTKLHLILDKRQLIDVERLLNRIRRILRRSRLKSLSNYSLEEANP